MVIYRLASKLREGPDRLASRLWNGPIVNEGPAFEEHKDEYEDIITDMDGVSVEVEEEHPVFPDRFYDGDSVDEEDLSGQEAWNYAANAIEERTLDRDIIDNTPLGELLDYHPFFSNFRHRYKEEEDSHLVKIRAEYNRHTPFEKDFVVTFDGKGPPPHHYDI